MLDISEVAYVPIGLRNSPNRSKLARISLLIFSNFYNIE